MRTKLSRREVAVLDSVFQRIEKLYDSLVDSPRDVSLQYGNGSVSSQLNCALAALETIMQELG